MDGVDGAVSGMADLSKRVALDDGLTDNGIDTCLTSASRSTMLQITRVQRSTHPIQVNDVEA
jgi:hypothetical protein